MNLPKRVIMINAELQIITEGVVIGLSGMQKLVGGYIERAHIFENGDELYVNEEGLLQNTNHFFVVEGFHQPFAGNAYVIGPVTANGNNRGAVSTVEEIKALVTFRGKGVIL